LVVAVAAGIVGIVGARLDASYAPGAATAIRSAAYAFAILAALAALVSKRSALPLTYLQLGLWITSLSWVIDDFGRLSAVTATNATTLMASDVTGLIAVMLLLAGLGRSAGRGRLTEPLQWALVAAVVLGHAAIDVFYLAPGAFLAWGSLSELVSFMGGYAASAEHGIQLATSAFVAWYALTLRDRALGSALLLGWLVTTAAFFAWFVTEFPSTIEAPNIQFQFVGLTSTLTVLEACTVCLLVVTLVLMIVYWLGRRSAAPSSAGA